MVMIDGKLLGITLRPNFLLFFPILSNIEVFRSNFEFCEWVFPQTSFYYYTLIIL